MRSLLPIAAAAVVGLSAWSGEVLALPFAVLFPALWAFAPSRWAAAGVSAGYFLAASRGLPQGVMNFYGSGLEAGIALWFAASLSFVAVHAVLWTRRRGWRPVIRYAIAAVLMSVPPFGIVGWAHPITAAGVIFPGWGWAGLASASIGLLVMTTRLWPIAILTLGGLWIWSVATWTSSKLPEGWVGVDTAFKGKEGEFASYEQQVATIEAVRTASASGAKVIVLPESALGIWTPTVESLWTQRLDDLEVVVIAGAVVVDTQGYDNVMIELSHGQHRIIYRERMPVPVSMWQPWLTWTGRAGGANAHFFENPEVETVGERIAPIICYEQLLVWPIVQSFWYSPDAVVAIGNGWWTDGTSIVAIQLTSVTAWTRLFDVSIVAAFNT